MCYNGKMEDNYKTHKLIVKKWESKFKRKEGRNSSKEDIKAAPLEVRKAYKLYWLLKTSVLESSILCEQEQNISNGSNSENSLTEDLSYVTEKDCNSVPDKIKCNFSSDQTNTVVLSDVISELDNSNVKNNIKLVNKPSIRGVECNVISEFNNSNVKNGVRAVNKPSVWGDHLNKSKSEKKQTLVRSFSSHFTEKLFEGTSFKKRNPRRYHSFTSRKLLNKEIDTDENLQHESCYESIIDDNSEDYIINVSTDEINSLKNNSILNVDDRAVVTFNKPTFSPYAINTLQKTLESEIPRTLKEKKFDDGWLERCNKECVLVESNLTKSIDQPPVDNTVKKEISPTVLISNLTESADEPFFIDNTERDNFLQLSTSTQSVNESVDNEVEQDDSFVMPNEIDSKSWNIVASILKEAPQTDHCSTNAKEKSCDTNLSTTNKRSLLQVESDIPKKRIKKCSPQKIACSPNAKKQQILFKKLASGKANENYVRINLKKKIFVRGKKTMTSSKYKKQQWKMKKKYLNQRSTNSSEMMSSLSRCFKCGDIGHYSKNCLKKYEEHILNDTENEIEDSPFPTLEEVAELAKANTNTSLISFNTDNIENSENCSTDIKINHCDVVPLYKLKSDGSVIDTPEEVCNALLKFGHEKFRNGQEESIMRVLSGQSTVVVLSTGAGKSLCYQLPAYLYSKTARCISLVISPLVSLMEDQITGIPSILKAVCLHTNQSEKQRQDVLDKLKTGSVSVLLISPEAIVSGERGCFSKNVTDLLPPIAFACIDEVHCISQWSHNFRPSYLLICKVLREKFNVKTFLGLTATATKFTIDGIIDKLSYNENDCCIIQNTSLPANLLLSVSKDEDKDRALISMLTSTPFNQLQSIIIYCIRRNECERVAALIRTCLQDISVRKGGRSRLSSEAEPYHAGLSASRRKQIQKAFMSGNLRIVVATVAFGMGINKSDIRGIVHYNMPRTFEHYVQEIGRAGRDSLPAFCHLFVDSKGNDLSELGRYIYADSVDRHIIRKLLQKVFIRCDCVDTCDKHEVAFSIEDTIKTLDLPQENIATLLCYLELHPKKWISVLDPSYIMCSIQSYNGILALKKAAKLCPPLAVIIALEEKKTKSSFTLKKIQFSVIKVANFLHWDSGIVKRRLKECEWVKENEKWRKTGILVEFYDLGFRVRAPGNLSADELDEALDLLYGRMQSQESTAVSQLQIAYSAFSSVMYESVEKCMLEQDVARSDKLKHFIVEYFLQENTPNFTDKSEEKHINNECEVICDIHRLITAYKDVNFSGRIIAKIFHGIESPNFPATVWARSPFWRSHIKQCFNLLCSIATKELIKFR